MNANWKQLVFVAALVSPMAVIANDGRATTEQQLAANDPAPTERSNHVTNKKAIAMEAKEERLSSPTVRDWSAIDTDKDHSISPEEMQKFLTGVWRAKEKS